MWTRLVTALRAYRIEIKYLALALSIMAFMALLGQLHIFDSIEDDVNRGMEDLASHGLIGMFLVALFSNMTLVIQVPYNMPLFTLVIYANTLWDVIALGMATAFGAGIGATMSYAVAHTIVSHVDDLDQSPLFRTTRRALDHHPLMIPVFVWFVSSTPVPDFSVIVPLAMANYPWQKLLIPMIIGKICNNVTVALAFRFATNRMARYVSGNVNFDVTATIVILFLVLIFYQVEKGRAATSEDAPSLEE